MHARRHARGLQVLARCADFREFSLNLAIPGALAQGRLVIETRFLTIYMFSALREPCDLPDYFQNSDYFNELLQFSIWNSYDLCVKCSTKSWF